MNSWPVFSGLLITQVTAGEESLRVPGLPAQGILRLRASLLLQVGGNPRLDSRRVTCWVDLLMNS